jgi:hypothetical protein
MEMLSAALKPPVQRGVTAAASGLFAAAARRSRQGAMHANPCAAEHMRNRAAVRLGRLLSSLGHGSATDVESVSAASAAAVAAAPPAAARSAAPPASGYRLPPPEIAAIVDAPPEPLLSFSPDRTTVLQLARPPSNPPISELSRPELKLAGMSLPWGAASPAASSRELACT